MSDKEVNLIIPKEMAIGVLNSFAQVLISDALKNLNEDVHKFITKYVEEMGKGRACIDLTQINFRNIGLEIRALAREAVHKMHAELNGIKKEVSGQKVA